MRASQHLRALLEQATTGERLDQGSRDSSFAQRSSRLEAPALDRYPATPAVERHADPPAGGGARRKYAAWLPCDRADGMMEGATTLEPRG
ncbi:MAG TPA: hypothetical protein VKG38_14905 [Solirubrobacteraceae bacterium]|nr:hypothetical protein [Solirubrobacteraceae bacterium]